MPAPTLEELAQRYLVTADGDTPGEPCGATGICNYNDRVQWTSRVKAVAAAMARMLGANPQQGPNKGVVTFTDQTLSEAMKFIARVFFLKKYPSMLSVQHTPQELAELAQRGVGTLQRMLGEIEDQGGVLPSMGPAVQRKDRGLPGNDWYYLGGALGAAFILWLWFKA